MAVGEHVQLVACISLSLLLGLREAGLVSRCQFNVYLHILQMEKGHKNTKYGKTIVILLHLQQASMNTFESTFEFLNLN